VWLYPLLLAHKNWRIWLKGPVAAANTFARHFVLAHFSIFHWQPAECQPFQQMAMAVV
jgi:hypothetical protein